MRFDNSGSPEAVRLRAEIITKTADYYRAAYEHRPFNAASDPVAVSGRVFDERELQTLVDASLDFWLTAGRYAERFEREFALRFGTRECILVNSGSSANLIALAMLTSRSLGERRLLPGDEVITAAAGFPTTVNPIVQIGCVPVFVDSELTTYNADLERLESALSSRTRAVFLAHTLGNPFDAARVRDFCRKHGLWFLEDTCDAVGATWDGRQVGTFGDVSTVSFYPAHHLTMGEGGAVMTGSPALRKLAESFRDWGRDCWCAPGADNTCGKRFDWKLGELPTGYDHKYTYSHLGYNLKLTDMQAAVGCAQLEKLDDFIATRRRHARLLTELLSDISWLVMPKEGQRAQASWFGFAIRLTPEAPLDRNALAKHLNARNIGTRLLFAGNLSRQPAYRDVEYRIAGTLAGADTIMANVIWIGTWPGLDDAAIRHVARSIREAPRYALAPVATL